MARDKTTETSGEAFVSDTARQQMKDDFKRRLNRGMAKKGWRQADLSRQTGIGKDSISKYANGQTVPTREYIEKLAQALNMSPHELWPNYDGAATAPKFMQRMERDPIDPLYAFVFVNARIRYGAAQSIMQIIDGEIADVANAG